MAKYRVTIEFTTLLSHDVEANSAAEAEQLADNLFQAYQKGDHSHIAGTDHHRSVERLSDVPSQDPGVTI